MEEIGESLAHLACEPAVRTRLRPFSANGMKAPGSTSQSSSASLTLASAPPPLVHHLLSFVRNAGRSVLGPWADRMMRDAFSGSTSRFKSATK